MAQTSPAGSLRSPGHLQDTKGPFLLGRQVVGTKCLLNTLGVMCLYEVLKTYLLTGVEMTQVMVDVYLIVHYIICVLGLLEQDHCNHLSLSFFPP